MNAATPVLDRGGHLGELALDRYRYDPPEPAFRAAVEAHLARCEACRLALAALAASDAALTLAPPERAAAPIPLAAARARARRRSAAKTALGTLAALAIAALALFVVRPWQSPEDVVTLKGKAFDFEVHVHDGDKSRPVQAGDSVYPGERMGFRVHLRRDGYLAVFGRDDRGMTYSCYPPADAGAPVATAVQAVAHTRTEHPETLPVAMRFDDILGDEHITAVFCEAPFSLGPDLAASAAALADAGCSVSELTLHKVAGGGAP